MDTMVIIDVASDIFSRHRVRFFRSPIDPTPQGGSIRDEYRGDIEIAINPQTALEADLADNPLEESAREGRQQTRDDEARITGDLEELERQRRITNALGQEELGRYEQRLSEMPTEISAGDRAELDRNEQSARARANAMAAELGMSDSTMLTSIINEIGTRRTIAESNLLRRDQYFVWQQAETHFQNAVAALGLSSQSIRDSLNAHNALAQIHANENAQTMAAFTTLISTAGLIVGTAYGGPAVGLTAAAGINATAQQFTGDTGVNYNLPPSGASGQYSS